MQVNINIEHGEDRLCSFPLEALVCFALEEMHCPKNSDVSITFVTNERIHELNRDYRGIDRPTDVLSFECDNIPFEGELLDEAIEYELGDVIIATDIAQDQSVEFDTTFEQEITLLVIHGLLHLCGYDHVTDEEAEEMEGLEDKLIVAWREHLNG